MPIETYESYQSWDFSSDILPERSILYSLEPIGVGTPLVESLNSYLIRLASIHKTNVWDFIHNYIAPLFFLNQLPKRLSQKDAVDSVMWQLHRELDILMRPDAEFWLDKTKHVSQVVRVLEILTGRKDIRYLTLLPWQTWRISFNNIFNTEQPWCVACYQEWRYSNTPVYQPLLWALETVTVCPYHQRYLQLYCLYCRLSQPFFKRHGSEGKCFYCGAWLGRFVDLPSYSQTIGQKFDLELWFAQAVGKLLAATPELDKNSLIQDTQVTSLRRKPTLKQFLRWCYRLEISPVQGLSLLGIKSSNTSTVTNRT